MGMRTYFLFFATLSVSAAVIGSQTAIVPPVIVKASKKNKSSLSGGPNAIVITREKMITTGVPNLVQALQTLANVQIQDPTNNGSQASLSLRGFGANASSNSLIVIDDIPIINPDLAPPDLNAIPIDTVESIEVISASEGVLFGDQAVGGVINIKTRDILSPGLQGECRVGSYRQHNCHIGVAFSKARLTGNLAFYTLHTDNYRQHNQYDQNMLLGKLNYNYPEGYIHFTYNLRNEAMQYPGALTQAQVHANRRQASNGTDFFNDWNGYLQLQQKQALNSDWLIETNLAARNMSGHGVLFSSFTQGRNTRFLKPTLKGTWGQSHIVTGLDIEEDTYRLSSAFGKNQDTQQRYGVFLIDRLNLNEVWALSLGARAAAQYAQLKSLNASTAVNRALADTFGINFIPTPVTRVYLRRAGSFRFPKADENLFTSPGTNGLRTQRGASYETGWEYEQPNTLIKLNFYQLDLRDEIAFDPTQTPTDPFGTNRNLAPTIRRGFDLYTKQAITTKIALDAEYTYVNARFQQGLYAGNWIPLVAQNMLHAGFTYQVNDHWVLYTDALFTGSEFPANDNANTAGKIGGYTLYNVSTLYQYGPFSATLRINNLFNKYYYAYTTYQSNNQTFFYPAAARNFLLTASYHFA